MNAGDFALGLGGGRRLVLAGIERGWLWLLVGAVVLALLLMLYRYERRLVTRRTGLILLTLRVLAALALVVALFEPIAEHVHREKVRGRILVGVDLSESMATPDPGRTATQKAQLRKILDLEPTESVESLTRREVARRMIAGDWLKKVATDHRVETLGFARSAVEGTPEALAKALGEPSRPDDYARLTTDWEPVLEHALADPDGPPVLGVVLLTDGRSNAPAPVHPALGRLKEHEVPIYPLLIGSTEAPRDAAVASLKAPETIDKGQTARIDVAVKADGVPAGTEVPVTLEHPGASPLRQTVRAQADGGRPVVTFRLPLEQAGVQKLTVAVGPVEGDVRGDNDRRDLTITVADDRAKVLLVDGQPRWEFQYVRNALTRDPRVTLEAVVFHQPPTPGSTEQTYATALPGKPEPPADPKVPAAPDPLGAFDAIIVGDVEPGDLDAEAWARLEWYVAERGGTLILSAGPRAWPALLADETARDLLPLADLRPVPVDPDASDPARPALPPGVPVAPTPAAGAGPWPMLQFAETPERSQDIWSDLPGLPWVLSGSPKPAATVLVTALVSGPGAESDSELEAEAESDSTVIAAQPFGLGKVLWVGTDGTWRWRFRVGDAYHHRFWGQAVQWATRGKLSAGNRLVQFGPVPPRVADGETPLIRARFAESAPDVTPDLLVAARVFRAPPDAKEGESNETGDPVAVVPLRAKADQPRVFEGSAPTLPPGSYLVRLDVPKLAEAMREAGPDGSGGEPEARLDVTPRPTAELVELAASRDALDALASVTGGRVFNDVEADRLPEALRNRVVVRTRVDPTRLGDRPEALLLFFALLTIEWALRKKAGLP